MMDASAPMGGKGAETEPTQTMGEITRPPKRGMVKLSLRKRTKTHLQRVNGPVVDTEIFTKRNNFAKETEAFDDQVAKMLPTEPLSTDETEPDVGVGKTSPPSDKNAIDQSSDAATHPNLKRKASPQQKPASAKKPRSSQASKNKSKTVTAEMGPGSVTGDQAQSGDESAIQPNNAIDQITQLKKRALEVPGADTRKINHDATTLKRAYNYLGADKVKAEDGKWLVQGMRTSLFDYQLLAVSLMIQRERSKTAPTGGILADVMGLGKTITALALVWRNQPPKNIDNRVTLVVVQHGQMANQWLDQLAKHVPKLAACRFTQKGKVNVAALSLFQVMIATYGDIERSWSGTQRKMTKKDASLDKDSVLFETEFFRLILDECHLIKNHRTSTAKAMFGLKAKHAWCISATPAPNGEDEYFPYLKVLGLQEGTQDLKAYHRHWTHNVDESGTTALERQLEKIQIRRTRETTIMGRPIFSDVPPNFEFEEKTWLSPEERLLYDMVTEPLRRELEEKQEEITVDEVGESSGLKEEAPKKERARFVSKILELYKLTAHPFMLESILSGEEFSLAQIQEILTKLRSLSLNPGLGLLQHLAKVCTRIGNDGSDCTAAPQYVSPDSQQGSSEATAVQLAQKEHHLSMEAQLKLILGLKAEERRCVRCLKKNVPSEAVLTNCGHIYCKRHWKNTVSESKEENEDGQVNCYECQDVVHEAQEINQDDLAKASDSRNAANQSGNGCGKASKKARKRGDDANGYQPQGKRSFFLEESDRSFPEVPMTQSAKTVAIMKLIDKWQQDAPEDKIIIFTQWLLMGKIIGRLLEDKGIPFLYNFGIMGTRERDKNLQDFKENSEIKVLVMGFKCGGTGLDLHRANRLILTDPFWNIATEAQAFGRIQRKVQEKNTFCVRLMVEDSIDMRIHEIKESKEGIVGRLVKEDDPYKRYEMEFEFANIALNGTQRREDDPSDENVNEDAEN